MIETVTLLAFVSQVFDPQAGLVLPQLLFFGASMALGGPVVKGLVSNIAGSAGRRLIANPRAIIERA